MILKRMNRFACVLAASSKGKWYRETNLVVLFPLNKNTCQPLCDFCSRLSWALELSSTTHDRPHSPACYELLQSCPSRLHSSILAEWQYRVCKQTPLSLSLSLSGKETAGIIQEKRGYCYSSREKSSTSQSPAFHGGRGILEPNQAVFVLSCTPTNPTLAYLENFSLGFWRKIEHPWSLWTKVNRIPRMHVSTRFR